jgi:hypothetical protein
MNEPTLNLCRRYSRAEQKLRDLIARNPPARELTDRVTGTSEDTANLFSSGTTPSVKMTMDSH